MCLIFFEKSTKDAIALTRSGISQCLTRLKKLEPSMTRPIQIAVDPAPGYSGVQQLSGSAPAASGYFPTSGNGSQIQNWPED